jgi:hypothetical protein
VSPQHGEVRGVRHTVVEPNIEVTRDLTEGVVLLCIKWRRCEEIFGRRG